MSVALDVLIIGLSCAYVLLAPYSKVEESFNVHATHDVLFHGVSPITLPKYDHFIFPGAVPRTFIGSVLLGWLSQPVIQLACKLELLRYKMDLQIIVRLVLAIINAIGLCLVRRSVAHRFGRLTGLFFALMTCTQFHLLFWIGRTLPNMFALFPVNIAIYLLWDISPNAAKPSRRATHCAIALLTFTAVVFRAEVALLLGPLVLQALVSSWSTFGNLLKVGVTAGVLSAALTIGVDSYFWGRWPLWPELYGFHYNVMQGKSAEWGVSPWHLYFTAFLPRILRASFPLSYFGIWTDTRIQSLFFPALVYILVLSYLGHKEWRFIIYIIPFFNVAAARGATWLVSKRKGTLFGRLCFLSVMGLLALNCWSTYLLTLASIDNYPGGQALAQFNERYATKKNVHVHISNLAAQTGSSLFLHENAAPYLHDICPTVAQPQFSWQYDKTEHVTLPELASWRNITHAIAEVDATTGLPDGFNAAKWRIVDTIESFDYWTITPAFKQALSVLDPRRLSKPLTMVSSAKLAILERSGR